MRSTGTSAVPRNAATAAAARAGSTWGSSSRQREASIRSARLPAPSTAITASSMSRPGESAASKARRNCSGSTSACRPISRYSASLPTPVGAALAYEILGCGVKPCEKAIGTAARRNARSKARAKSRCDVKRSGPRFAYRIRIRWTTGAWPPTGWFLGEISALRCLGGDPQVVDRGQGQQFPAGRADLDLGVHRGADAAVEARGPAAVVLLVLAERILPVLPEPVLVQAGVEVVPREHLGLVALAGGEPVEVDAEAGQHLGGRFDPAGVREVLAPAVETSAFFPDAPDDGADAPIAPRQQALDQ